MRDDRDDLRMKKEEKTMLWEMIEMIDIVLYL